MPLFRRREVPVPTLAGWLVLIAVVAACAIGIARVLFPLLAPIDPVGGGLLVVEGWGGGAVFDEAASRFRRGGYDGIVTTGGPIDDDDTAYVAHRNWAAHAATELQARGIEAASIAVVPAPPSARERTYLSAVMLREWLAQQGDDVTRFDVITRGPHGRRSRRLFQRAFGDGVEVGVISVPSHAYDPAHWWASSEGTRSVVTEALGMAWTLCCFDPGPRGSEQEKWGE